MRERKWLVFFACIVVFLLVSNGHNRVMAEGAASCSPDITAPVISNYKDFHLEAGSVAPDYLEDVVIEDNCGTYRIFVQSDFVDTTTVGIYPLYYFATDPFFNATQVVVTVYVHYDITNPVLTGAKDLSYKVNTELTNELLLEGLTATDNKDGDITTSITVDYLAVDNETVGIYDAIYTVVDASGNITTETIQVTIYDDESPIIIAPDPSPILEVGSSEPDWLSYITVTDNYDASPLVTITENTVDLSTIGTYSITYKAVDSEGNEVTKTLTIDVVDTTAPVIVAPNQSYEVDTDVPDWTTLITVTDNYDMNLTITIDDSLVNFNILGIYTVTITALDDSGNETVSTFTVTITDDTAPVVVAPNQAFEVGTDVPDWTTLITVTDNYDTNLTVTIDDTLVNFNLLGVYTVTVTVRDDSGNETVVTFTVTISDDTAPVVVAPDQVYEVFSVVPNWLDLITVTDNYETIITVVIDDTLINFNVLGTYNVTITATDNSGNETVFVFLVTIVDTVKPEFNTIDSFKYIIGDANIDYLAHLVVTDNYDGIIPSTQVIIYDQYVDLATDGCYPITFEVMDSSGNYNYTVVFIRVSDETGPVLDGVKSITIGLDNDADYLTGITATDNIQNDITDRIIVDDTLVNYSVVGTYLVNYIVTDLSGNVTIESINLTVVEDTTSPVITGTKDLSIEVNSDVPNYLLGVVATDNVDVVVTLVVESSLVDLTVLGTYEITYLTTDASGNSTEVKQNVTVVDTTVPVITGSIDVTISVGSTFNPVTGIGVTDNYDTNVNVIASDNHDLSTTGSYTITLTATDDSGNVTVDTYQLSVVDDIKPIVQVSNREVEIDSERLNWDDLITVTDNYDTSVTVYIDDTLIEYDTTGTYSVTVIATDDSANETTVSFTVTVTDTEVVSEHVESNDVWLYALSGAGAVAGILVIIWVIKRRKK